MTELVERTEKGQPPPPGRSRRCFVTGADRPAWPSVTSPTIDAPIGAAVLTAPHRGCQHGRMNTTITLARRFCGPPDSANGGYTAGTLAPVRRRHGRGDVATTAAARPATRRGTRRHGLHAARRRRSRRGGRADDGRARLPRSVPVRRAVEASRSSPFRDMTVHPFPTCFACGPAREKRRRTTAVRRPDPRHRDLRGTVGAEGGRRRIVWAALDCPSCAVIYLDDDHPPPHVLGRIAARDRSAAGPRRPVRRHELAARRRRSQGELRRARSSTTRTARMCAVARATWIRLAAAP